MSLTCPANISPHRLATKFCKDSSLNTNAAKDITPADAGIKGYEDYKFSFKWEKSDDGQCSSSCIDIFTGFTSSSVCSYDSHTKAASGTQKISCGTASFDFSNGKPEPTPTEPSTSTTYVDQGNLACGKEQDMGNPNHFVNLETMNKAITFFCGRQLIAKTPNFRPGKVSDQDKHVELSYNHHEHDPVYVAMDWIDNPGCPTTDFANVDNFKTCIDRLGLIVNTCKSMQQPWFYVC